CMRSAMTVRGSPPSSTAPPRARRRWKPPAARSRAGSILPSRVSAPCSRRPSADAREGEGRVMAQVTVTIHGRQFRLACEDGQEAHLARLAAELDKSIESLRQRFGEIGDTRLTIMAALM